MPYDWKALAPTRPLSISESGIGDLYIQRPGDGAREIDALLNAGLEQPIALFGPAGSGKSTELAALAKLRGRRWVGPLVRLDKMLAYSEATSVNDVLAAIARRVVDVADLNGLSLSPELTKGCGGLCSPSVGQFPKHLNPGTTSCLLPFARSAVRAQRSDS